MQAVAYTRDGKSLVTASKSIRVWDAKTGQLIRESAASPHFVIDALAVAPNGRTLAWTGRDETIHVQEIATGKEVHRLKGHKYYSAFVVFSPDGKMLASGGRDDTIRLWDVTTGKEIRTLNNPRTTTYLAFLPDGKSLVSFAPTNAGNGPGELRVWDVETRKVLRKWEDVYQPILLSPDGKLMVTGSKDHRLDEKNARPEAKDQHLLLLDATTRKEVRRFALPIQEEVINYEAARCVAFSHDSKLLAAGDMTSRVHIWEVETGKELYCSPPHPNWVTCLTFSPDNKTLAVGAWQRILLLDSKTGKDKLPIGGHATQVNHVAFAPDGKTVATWTQEAIFLWDPQTGRQRRKLAGGMLLGFSPDGNMLLGGKGSIIEWQIDQSKSLRTFKVYDRAPPDDIVGLSAVYSRDGKLMATGSYDRTVRLWDLTTGKVRWRARRENKGVRFPADIGGHWPLGFTHDGKAVVSIADDAVIRFWDVANGKEVRWFQIGTDEGALSPDGRLLVVTGKRTVAPDGKSETSGTAPPRLYDLTKDGDPQTTKFYPKDAGPAAFSPDTRTLALAVGADVVLLECPSGKVIRRLKGHQDHINDLAFSPDGRLLVSGSYDRTALVWKVR